MATKRTRYGFLWLVVSLALLVSVPLHAEHHPASKLLLPCFEVTLDRSVNTLFAVGNVEETAVRIDIVLTTNWGIEVLRVPYVLDPKEVLTVNLHDWLVGGKLPNLELMPKLTPDWLAHLQAALCGERSPSDGLFYSTMGDPADPTLMVGNVQIEVQDGATLDALFGDFFIVREDQDYAMGDILVSHEEGNNCCDVCTDHAVRYLDGGAFDGSSMLLIWTPLQARPSESAYLPEEGKMDLFLEVYSEAGERIDYRHLRVLPVDMISIAELALPERFGWFEIHGERETAISVTHSATRRFTVGYLSHCIDSKGSSAPGIDLEKHTNGFDADHGMGPRLAIGAKVTWTFHVTNIGPVPLEQIVVTDEHVDAEITCPGDALEPGESMTCTAEGRAEACYHANHAFVSGTWSGGEVGDDDWSHYYGDTRADLSIEKSTNGLDADLPPGPTLVAGETVEWRYRVENTGSSELREIVVTDDQGVVVACPATSLAVGEWMECSAVGTAIVGQYANVGQVTAVDVCGAHLQAEDPSHYFGESPAQPAIRVEKATNGVDADQAPGPTLTEGTVVTWTYVVTNVGDQPLHDVALIDDREGPVACPKTALGVGESMTCSHSGIAGIGAYVNLATASGKDPSSQLVTDTDPSHYHGVEPPQPAVTLEKATNGFDADAAPGPTANIGSVVTWSYVVTNVGNVALEDVAVTDGEEGAVPCPKSTLGIGESMTCTLEGTAQACQYANLGSVTARDEAGTVVGDDDPSHYYGEPHPAIDIEKYTNGVDADVERKMAVRCKPGDDVVWKYVVTNLGDVELTDVLVVDDQIGSIDCPTTVLGVGESMTCYEYGRAKAGEYQNVGTVTANAVCGHTVTDSDSSHYYGQEYPE